MLARQLPQTFGKNVQRTARLPSIPRVAQSLQPAREFTHVSSHRLQQATKQLQPIRPTRRHTSAAQASGNGTTGGSAPQQENVSG